jgi:hypothetical protein
LAVDWGGAVAVADDNEDFTERTISFRAAMAQVPSAQAEVPAHLLLVLADNAPPRHVPLQVLPLTIGRTLPSDLLLDGSTVSRIASSSSRAIALC